MYTRPKTLEEAVAILADGEAQVLSGGTDFYPALGDRPVRTPIVDVSRLDELRGVSTEKDWIRIGGLTTWSEVIRASLARCFDALKSAAREVGTVQDWRSPAKADVDESRAARSEVPPHHAPFASLEEVLRVPGMSRAILYGSAELDAMGKVRFGLGASRDLTVRSGSQLNINYASAAALRSVPGIDADLAQTIIGERRRDPFKTVTEVNDRIAGFLPDDALPYLTTGETNIYSIISTGEVDGSPVRRTVEAVVQFVSEGSQNYRIVSWYDDWNDSGNI